MDLGLRGKACIVTGASKGIGAEIARAFIEEGASVALIARHREPLEEVAKKLRALGGTVFVVTTDLATEDGGTRGIQQAAAELGRIDILVNNAGSSPLGSFDKVSDQEWMDTFALKPMGYVRTIRAALPFMRAQKKGRIVNVVGAGGRWAVAEYVMGCMNATVLHLTKSLGELLAPEGITVTAINPGPTGPTERFDRIMTAWAQHLGLPEEEFRRKYERDLPLRRIASTTEVARMVVLMASDVTAYATGGALQADGASARGVF